jgi:hypothetical protein
LLDRCVGSSMASEKRPGFISSVKTVHILRLSYILPAIKIVVAIFVYFLVDN